MLDKIAVSGNRRNLCFVWVIVCEGSAGAKGRDDWEIILLEPIDADEVVAWLILTKPMELPIGIVPEDYRSEVFGEIRRPQV